MTLSLALGIPHALRVVFRVALGSPHALRVVSRVVLGIPHALRVVFRVALGNACGTELAQQPNDAVMAKTRRLLGNPSSVQVTSGRSSCVRTSRPPPYES